MTTLEVVKRPSSTADPSARSPYRRAGIALGAGGLGVSMVVLVVGAVAATLVDDPGEANTVAQIAIWNFGLNTVALAALKMAIAVVLAGILVRLWMRVDSVKAALPALVPEGHGRLSPIEAEIDTPYGPAKSAAEPPDELLIHRVAKVLWAPMLVMGAMLVAGGFVLSLIASGNIADDTGLARQQSAWVQGSQFLGEAFLLGGISFLLGSILGALRKGGGEVQASVGASVRTLDMPPTAKAFVVLMAAGVMVSMAQFVGYIVAAGVGDATSFAAWSAWLGPFREFGLGLLLAGIVLALATIGNVLGFQFNRINELIRTGH